MPNLVTWKRNQFPPASSESGSSSFVLGFMLLTFLAVGCGAVLASHLLNETRQQFAETERESRRSAGDLPPYVHNARLRELEPIVTNLAAPKDKWIRLQSSLILGEGIPEDIDILTSRIEEDIVTYLRTLKLAHIEGPVGLQHLREDLNERARLRSDGAVREVVLESLVIQ
jgi:flagellar FliL protein